MSGGILSTGLSILVYSAAILTATVIMQATQSLIASPRGAVPRQASGYPVLYAVGTMAAFLPAAFLTAFRVGIGLDYQNYVWLYQERFASIGSLSDFLAASADIEPGFILLNLLLRQISTDARLLFVVCAFLTLGMLAKGIYAFIGSFSAGLCAYALLLLSMPSSFNIMRQTIALSLVWCALGNMLKRRPLHFAAFSLIAATFHYSSLIMLPMYFACGESRASRYARRGIAAAFFLFFALFAISGGIPFLGEFSGYFLGSGGGIGFGIFVLRIPFFILYCYYRPIVTANPNYRILYYFLWFELVFASLGYYNPVLTRIGLYFQLSWAILLPCAVRNARSRVAHGIAAFYVIMALTGNFIWEFIYHNYGGWLPYSFQLF